MESLQYSIAEKFDPLHYTEEKTKAQGVEADGKARERG
jgi:hypothetical protein